MSEAVLTAAPPRRHLWSRLFGWMWPHSLRGQVMAALALALLLAQGISAALLYRAQGEYREEQVTHALAIKLVMASRGDMPPPPGDDDRRGDHGHHEHHGPRPRMSRAGRAPNMSTSSHCNPSTSPCPTWPGACPICSANRI
jgi:hypothetical protein